MIALLKLVPVWVWLLVALAGSVYYNAVQWADARATTAAHAQAMNAALLQGQVVALTERADALDLQGRQLAAEAQALIDNLTTINLQEQAQLSMWRGFVRQLPPLPTGCGPGAPRVEAFNSVMRGDP